MRGPGTQEASNVRTATPDVLLSSAAIDPSPSQRKLTKRAPADDCSVASSDPDEASRNWRAPVALSTMAMRVRSLFSRGQLRIGNSPVIRKARRETSYCKI